MSIFCCGQSNTLKTSISIAFYLEYELEIESWSINGYNIINNKNPEVGHQLVAWPQF